MTPLYMLTATIQAQDLSQIVQTDKGPVQGRIYRTVWHSKPYSSYQGIPFAKPPVGPLRFRKPVEADPWTDVWRALNYVGYCPQMFTLAATGDEDCLYLNVYVPEENVLNITTPKAVMVYIYGGGFTTGWSFPGVYGPDYLLEEDVIVVVFNYRVDIFGFLALDIDGVEGNAALWDQIMALRWVKKNIAAFGGDPNQITLFGESAGSASVSYQMFLPESEGLFNKVILQSATALCPWAFHTRAEAVHNTVKVANGLGFFSANQSAVLEFLEHQTPHDLLKTSRIQGSYLVPLPIDFPFVPTVTKDLLDECPIKKLRTGKFAKVPVLMGYNSDEAELFSLAVDVGKQILSSSISFMANLNPLGGGIWDDFAKSLLNATEEEIIEAATTYYFVSPIDLTQRYFTQHNPDNPLYYYRLSNDAPELLHNLMDNNVGGVAHADDLGIIFNIGIITNNDPETEFNQFRKKVVSLWANFAKYTDPTPNNVSINGAVWEPSGLQGLQIDLNETFSMHPRFADSKAVMWEKFYDAVLPYSSLCDDPLAIATLGAQF
ncbi:BCHE [Anthophora quadrimaculata]